jgi:hypothetical protein
MRNQPRFASCYAAISTRRDRRSSWTRCAPQACQRDPSQLSCVEPLDLASVSPTMRPVSDSVRRARASVSPNVRRKVGLIARRAVHHCASLQVVTKAAFGINWATVLTPVAWTLRSVSDRSSRFRSRRRCKEALRGVGANHPPFPDSACPQSTRHLAALRRRLCPARRRSPIYRGGSATRAKGTRSRSCVSTVLAAHSANC